MCAVVLILVIVQMRKLRVKESPWQELAELGPKLTSHPRDGFSQRTTLPSRNTILRDTPLDPDKGEAIILPSLLVLALR